MLRLFGTDYSYEVTVLPFHKLSGGCHAFGGDGKLYSIIASPEDISEMKYKYLDNHDGVSSYFVWENWHEILGLLERGLNCQPKQIETDLNFFKKHLNLIRL